MHKACRSGKMQPIAEVLTPWINSENQMWNSDLLNLVDNPSIQTISKSFQNSCQLQNRAHLHSGSNMERKYFRRPLSLCESACEERQKIGKQLRIRRNEKLVNKNSKYIVKASCNAEEIFLSTKVTNLKLKVVKMFESTLQPIKKEVGCSNSSFYRSQKVFEQKSLLSDLGKYRQDVEKKWLKLRTSNIVLGNNQIKSRQFECIPLKKSLLRFGKQKRITYTGK